MKALSNRAIKRKGTPNNTHGRFRRSQRRRMGRQKQWIMLIRLWN